MRLYLLVLLMLITTVSHAQACVSLGYSEDMIKESLSRTAFIGEVKLKDIQQLTSVKHHAVTLELGKSIDGNQDYLGKNVLINYEWDQNCGYNDIGRTLTKGESLEHIILIWKNDALWRADPSAFRNIDEYTKIHTDAYKLKPDILSRALVKDDKPTAVSFFVISIVALTATLILFRLKYRRLKG